MFIYDTSQSLFLLRLSYLCLYWMFYSDSHKESLNPATFQNSLQKNKTRDISESLQKQSRTDPESKLSENEKLFENSRHTWQSLATPFKKHSFKSLKAANLGCNVEQVVENHFRGFRRSTSIFSSFHSWVGIIHYVRKRRNCCRNTWS